VIDVRLITCDSFRDELFGREKVSHRRRGNIARS
jgi:hypothetical protein